jgi:uncharacterized protein with HEPN domain
VRDDAVYLRYIAESIEQVQSYVAGAGGAPDEELFRSDQRTQDAVLHRMETLAEAVSHLSGSLKARHPEIPWRAIVGFRNIVAHDYIEVDLYLAWQAITDLATLNTVVQAELGRSRSP